MALWVSFWSLELLRQTCKQHNRVIQVFFSIKLIRLAKGKLLKNALGMSISLKNPYLFTKFTCSPEWINRITLYFFPSI